ncbi:hypothetical protein [Streptomyces sp. 8L]|uniref:hypothetical protein n=1 Tax=Streptomyces sp. 8L TaxID=2877242 RepID=UPI001CD2E516|nr:hypothetical protein [Streptomyces sp. 8L]MCA1221464.1 hypothetical protein [Streptomyces sp. 8L]
MTTTWPTRENSSPIGQTAKTTLADSCAALSAGYRDRATTEAITRILAGPAEGRTDATGALDELQELLEQIRQTPEGDLRVSRMNSFVRTLGRSDNLAAFLELMRASLKEGPGAHGVSERSRAGRSHCIYGWAGQSLVLASDVHALPSTEPAGDGVQEFMGGAVAEWHASLHIWQPNPEALGFESTKRFEPGTIVEPPHSHPFSFVSYVSVGELRQSIYEEDSAETPSGTGDRYQDVDLERVGGVWPPHDEYVPSRLRTVEERVRLEQGQSYFMSPDMIHDVEVDRDIASERPTITLFLCSETVKVPVSYLVPSMAEFHRDNPEILSAAQALDPEVWDAKLAATARYLRGESDELRLGDIVNCGSSYGFMNR